MICWLRNSRLEPKKIGKRDFDLPFITGVGRVCLLTIPEGFSARAPTLPYLPRA